MQSEPSQAKREPICQKINHFTIKIAKMSHKNLNEGIQPIPVEWQKEEQEWNEAIKVSYEKKVRELVAENGQLLEDNVGLRHQIEIGKKEKSELQNALEHAKKSDPEVEGKFKRLFEINPITKIKLHKQNSKSSLKFTRKN